MPALDANIVPARTPAIPTGGSTPAAPRTTRPGAARAGTSSPHAASKGDGFGELVARFTQDGEDDARAVKSSSRDTAAKKETSESGDPASEDAAATQNAANNGIAVYHHTRTKSLPFPWTLPFNTDLLAAVQTGSESATEGDGATTGTAATAGGSAIGANRDSSGDGSAVAATGAASGAANETVNMLVSQLIAANAGTAQAATTAATVIDTTSTATAPDKAGDQKNDDGPAVNLAASIVFTPTVGKRAIGGSLAQNVATDAKVASEQGDTGILMDTGLPSTLSFASTLDQTAGNAGASAAANTNTAPVPTVVEPQGSGDTNADVAIDSDSLLSTTPAASPVAILSDHARRQATRELLRAMQGSASAPDQGQNNAAQNGAVQNGTTGSTLSGTAAQATIAGANGAVLANAATTTSDAGPRLADKGKDAHVAETFISNGAAAHGFAASDASSSDVHDSAQHDGGDASASDWSSSRLGAESHTAANFGTTIDAAAAPPSLHAMSSSLADAGQGAGAIGAALNGAGTHASGTVGAGSADAANNHLPFVDTTASTDDQASQIVRSMRMQWRGPVGEATLRLQPEHLGTVLVNVRVEQGVVTATLHAETPAAQQWIQTHQQNLRDALDAQGLRVANLHVTTNPDDRPRRDRDQQQSAPDREAPRGRNRRRDWDAPTFEIRI